MIYYSFNEEIMRAGQKAINIEERFCKYHIIKVLTHSYQMELVLQLAILQSITREWTYITQEQYSRLTELICLIFFAIVGKPAYILKLATKWMFNSQMF